MSAAVAKFNRILAVVFYRARAQALCAHKTTDRYFNYYSCKADLLERNLLFITFLSRF